MTKVYFIQHSCFLIEFDDKYLLFDYFNKESISDIVSFHGSLPSLDKNKKLYIFASHSHKDHFTIDVLNFIKDYNVFYIFSKDIKLDKKYLKQIGFDLKNRDKIKFVSADNKYKIDDMVVETLRSNEAGVAFVVNTNGQSIFHAGDLNWWNVEGRGELYGEQYGREYKRALHHILNRHFDIGFVVLDTRLTEDGYFLGLDYFIKNIDCDNIFPMHMWGKYDMIERFKSRPDIVNLKDRVVDITSENMLFEIED